ncbi:RnfABCDGE type electron transport complex subunit D [Cytobacillus pseudoceanisediminis]|uniref:RnfABCDGE type electron transport complex subunit D n=1 Tax=Cytobacillus pseudoceanisediminis TaxID=3051614 RepID=UPI003C2BE564
MTKNKNIVNPSFKMITSWSDYKVDPRYFLLLFLASFFTAGQVYLGFFQTWDALIISVATTVLTELILTRIIYKEWKISLSPFITGIGVSLLLSSHVLWAYALTAFLSILLKFIIRYKGGHVFNPNNLAMVLMLFLLPDFAVSTPKQWTNGIAIMLLILCLGLFVTYLANRLDTVLTFLGGFFFFGLMRHFFFGAPLLAAIGPSMGASLQLFAFYMITDPKTTPGSRKARIVFALLVAAVDAVFRINRIPNPQFYALFLVCLFFILPYRYFTKPKNEQKI